MEVLPWIGMCQWIADYVKGCAICQQNKILTHRTKVPLYRIMTKEGTLPFQQIAMDLITGLLQHHRCHRRDLRLEKLSREYCLP